jgi:starch synthase
MSRLPVILFEPEGYVLDGPKLMGRQSAGNSFLRAAIAAAEKSTDPALVAWTPLHSSATVFKQVVGQFSPKVKPDWIQTGQLDRLAKHGSLFLPGPGLAEAARQRLRVGPAAYSLTGATYTLCSHLAMDAIIDIIPAPVMPWDALICATSVAQHAVRSLFQLQAEYLAWRFGISNFVIPQLPIIPFGIHPSDFAFTAADKTSARASLQLAEDDVAFLFAGRLSFHAKAHPFPMIAALEQAAQRTKQKVALVLCGQFPNSAIQDAFTKAASLYAPHVRTVWVDGKNPTAYNRAWAASNVFVSLSDNLQETFGITPVEAMASGLPVVAADWDGYKDTVVEGVTGFRIPTWMPPPDIGMALAAAFEAGTINYDRYIGLACLEVSVDNALLIDRLIELIQNPQLRERMGAAGKDRVAKVYDWSVVMNQHITLWKDLDGERLKAQTDQAVKLKSAPACAPARQDPYRVFASFPTQMIGPTTMLSRSQMLWEMPAWDALMADSLFTYAQDFLPQAQFVQNVLDHLSDQAMSIEDLAKQCSTSIAQVIKWVAPMAKVGLVSFSSAPSE